MIAALKGHLGMAFPSELFPPLISVNWPSGCGTEGIRDNQ
jgi:hypothetical protein